MNAKAIVVPFFRDELAGKQFLAQKSWASCDEIVTINLDGIEVDVLLDTPAPFGSPFRVEIVGKEIGFWYGRHYTYLATCV
jgi:hypothetical protein